MTSFDSNATRRRLEASGFTPEQADGAVTIVSEVAGQTFVTQAMLDHRLREMELRIMRFMFVQAVAIVGVTVALLRFAG